MKPISNLQVKGWVSKKSLGIFRDNFDAAEKFRKLIMDKYGVQVELVSGSIKENKTVEKYFKVKFMKEPRRWENKVHAFTWPFLLPNRLSMKSTRAF